VIEASVTYSHHLLDDDTILIFHIPNSESNH
jgi:hypothetical protein